MNKELINRYAELDNPKDESMKEWVRKNLFDVVETDDGNLIGIYKTHLETRFCFSYDEQQDYQCGTDSYGEANNMAGNVGYDYFLKENLHQVKYETEEKRKMVISTYDKDGIAYFNYQLFWKELSENERYATESEMQRINAVLEEQLKSVEKRCKTWWKKYGKEHLSTWTYSCWD